MRVTKELKGSAIVAAAALAISGTVQAATWTGGVSTDFAASGNWDTAPTAVALPPTNGGTAPANLLGGSSVIFGTNAATVNHPSLSASFGVAGLRFEGSGWTLNGASTLFVSRASGVVTTNTTGTNTINAPLSVGTRDSAVIGFNVAGGATDGVLRINAPLYRFQENTGGGAVIKTGGGTLELNSSSGGLTTGLSVQQGTFKRIGSADGIAGTVSISSGAVVDVQGADLTFGQLQMVDGALITNTSLTARTLRPDFYQSFTARGTIAGSLNVVWKANNNTITLPGGHSYTGTTTVSSMMTLLVSNATGSATSSGAVTVQDNAALAGTGNIAGIVTFNADTTSDANLYGAILRPTSATDLLSLGGISGATTAALDLVSMTGLNASTSYKIVTYGGSGISGFGTTLNQPLTHNVSYSTPGEIWLVPVPEPTVVGMAVGVASMALVRRRRSA